MPNSQFAAGPAVVPRSIPTELKLKFVLMVPWSGGGHNFMLRLRDEEAIDLPFVAPGSGVRLQQQLAQKRLQTRERIK